MNAIYTRRRALNLTQSQLAEKVGCSLRSIQKWEKGQPVPKWMKRLLEQELGISLGDGDAAAGLFAEDDNNAMAGGGNGHASTLSSALDKALNEIAELRKALCEERRINQENTSRFLGIIETIRGVSNAE